MKIPHEYPGFSRAETDHDPKKNVGNSLDFHISKLASFLLLLSFWKERNGPINLWDLFLMWGFYFPASKIKLVIFFFRNRDIYFPSKKRNIHHHKLIHPWGSKILLSNKYLLSVTSDPIFYLTFHLRFSPGSRFLAEIAISSSRLLSTADRPFQF